MVKTIVKTRKIYRRNKTQMGGDDTNIPTIKDNMERLINIFKKAFIIVNVYLLNKFENKLSNISNSYGINPNETLEDQISKISKKAEDLNNVLNTPEGQQALSNLKNLFNKITKEVIVPTSTQLAVEIIESLQPIMIRGQNAAFSLLSASPFGAIFDIPRFLSESLGVLEKSVTLVNNTLKIINGTFDKIEDNKAEVKEEVSKINSLINNANEKISSGLNMIEDNVNDNLAMPTSDTFVKSANNFTKSASNNFTKSTNNFVKSANNFVKPVNNFTKSTNNFVKPVNNFNRAQAIQNGGGTLKTYRNQAKMIGGRIIKSQLEFMKPYTTTQKRALNHNLTFRKR
jgi:predicted  nucleic acid-binding Zn-ribbon protein